MKKIVNGVLADMTADETTEWEQRQVIDPAVVLAAERARASVAMLQRIEAFTAQFTAGVPAAELASWPTKALHAELVLSGGTSEMIDAEAAALGISAQTVAEQIAVAAAKYTSIIGAVTGMRRKTEAGIAAAETPEQVQVVLDGALQTAQGMAEAMGLTF